MAWAQSTSIQAVPWRGSCVCSDFLCVFMHVHARSSSCRGAGSTSLAGLVFLDLESKCKDQLMISAFGDIDCTCYLLRSA